LGAGAVAGVGAGTGSRGSGAHTSIRVCSVHAGTADSFQLSTARVCYPHLPSLQHFTAPGAIPDKTKIVVVLVRRAPMEWLLARRALGYCAAFAVDFVGAGSCFGRTALLVRSADLSLLYSQLVPCLPLTHPLWPCSSLPPVGRSMAGRWTCPSSRPPPALVPC